jgi:hypothetical protein
MKWICAETYATGGFAATDVGIMMIFGFGRNRISVAGEGEDRADFGGDVRRLHHVGDDCDSVGAREYEGRGCGFFGPSTRA